MPLNIRLHDHRIFLFSRLLYASNVRFQYIISVLVNDTFRGPAIGDVATTEDKILHLIRNNKLAPP